MTLQIYRAHLTPLSPVHVGCGESFEPTNYVIEDGWLHAFDTGAAIAALTAVDRKALLDIGNRRPGLGMLREAQRFFHERRESLAPFATRLVPVLPAIERLHAERVGQVAQHEQDGRKVINQLAIERTSFDPVSARPVLYGSSIKGAIRTALLDSVNQGRTASESKGLHEFQGRLLQYLNDRGRPQIELDPLRLLHVSDMRCVADVQPQSQIWYAVDRKKAEVRDAQGQLRRSQAEAKEIYQVLECLLPWQHRSFEGELTISDVGGLPWQDRQGRRLLPAADLRPALEAMAGACNCFYQRRLQAELEVLERRGYVDAQWRLTIQQLLAAAQKRLDAGQMMLLRVGRHSGAESVTLEGVRRIKILEGKDPDTGRQRSSDAREARTVWLAAREKDDRQGLLPFGWLLVEIAPIDAPAPPFEPLAAACKTAGAARLEQADGLRARMAELERRRREVQERQKAEADRARQAAEARLQAERLAAQKQQLRAAMTANLREVDGFVEAMQQRADQLRGGRERPNAESHQRAQQLAKRALEGADWTADERRAASDAIQEWLPKVVQLPDAKAAFKKLGLRRLRGEQA